MDILKAARDGHLKELKNHIAAGANLRITDYSLNTPLHLAAKGPSPHNIPSVKALLQAGATIEAKNEDNETPLHLAARSTNTDCIQLLIDSGSDINAKSDYGTPLTIAASFGNDEAVKIFISLGADIQAKDHQMYTPLHLAAVEGYASTCQVLCDAGANLNENQNQWGKTPLHIAASGENGNGHQTCAKIILKAGGDPSLLDYDSKSPEELSHGSRVRDARLELLTEEKAALQLEGPQNLPDRPTPRISRGRM